MQWVFMIIGALMGALIDPMSSMLGGCIGLFLGGAIKTQMLSNENKALRQELEAINHRLDKTENFIKRQLTNTATVPTAHKEEASTQEALNPQAAKPIHAPQEAPVVVKITKPIETKKGFSCAPAAFFIRQISIIELTEKQKRQPKVNVNTYHTSANKPEQTVTLATQPPRLVTTIEEPQKASRCLVFAPANFLISQAAIIQLTDKPQVVDDSPAIVVSSKTQVPPVETIKIEIEQPIKSVNHDAETQPAFVRAATKASKAPAVSHEENIINVSFG